MLTQASVHDLVGDLVLYRNLDPADGRLPRFAEAWQEMGLPEAKQPRKLEPAYAQAMAWILQRAQALTTPTTCLKEIVALGDTRLNDGNAFRNLKAATGWAGWCFIGSESADAFAPRIEEGLYVANRWCGLVAFLRWMLSQGACLDQRTAVIVDIDKTALGARGRNDRAIDGARVVAAEAVAAQVLGAGFDRETFRTAYAELNRVPYHPFTADNQDNLAYACLVLSAGLLDLAELVGEIQSGRLERFPAFVEQVEARRAALTNPALRALHDDFRANMRAGDPTPFKAFRRQEYLETVGRMGHLPDTAPAEQRLAEEICLTREVVQTVAWLRARGCLLLAVSDKPDEASTPSPALAAEGHLPLHRQATHIIGESIAEGLAEL